MSETLEKTANAMNGVDHDGEGVETHGKQRHGETVEGDPVAISTPDIPAEGEVRGAVVFFSSASENTARFIRNCHLEHEGINVYRIPLHRRGGSLNIREPYILVVPTYGGGSADKAIPTQVRLFLNDRENRDGIRGVIASGNTNFGEAFCMAGDLVSKKCKVPFLYYFELMGTREDEEKVRKGVPEFFANLKERQ
ncbi:MAG: class Ib ribonucleoside-diphosphate reductase assembly flavoprotein NrdI [Bifidobacterium aquikefiri]|uniref:Protein NrdI n=2 Tax=Bifidobacterium aquikefiri TaxID=1653207 RepID=A0A261G9K1_9BIFI|nr:class Ib ribonucleoside-diphosphate reductase assembly flavoprotein NrdI [Bifidobacterium aquikefiri]OZG67666.1 ribonucleotide reductase [Bifidobacterium aquikefiri]